MDNQQMALKRAGALRIGDIVRHDPAYGTRAVILFVGRGIIRGDVSLGFHNVYEGDSYSQQINGLRMFEIEKE